ncbi:MAG: response regulator [Planctomycetes bacterium]|nr:response regulator [Planctomycetota bacterium]
MAKQVLIIDDDQTIAKYLCVALSEHGYDPVSAPNGKEGLEQAMRSRPDLIVLDVMMPGKSGFVLFKQLKRDEQFKDIPILMLTGISGVLEDLESHQDETFEKPYEPLREALRKKIQELRDEGLVKPEMFVDKPVDPDSFIVRVQELIGS